MIKFFLSFLEEQNISYRITNGYEEIEKKSIDHSDYDILFTKNEFNNIDSIILKFALANNLKIVQMYHQGQYAKNFFLFDPKTLLLLNLDLYGQLSRHNISILDEREVFNKKLRYKGLAILEPEQEFIQYLIKKIDKGVISLEAFEKLRNLFTDEEKKCVAYLKLFFKDSYQQLSQILKSSDYDNFQKKNKEFKSDFLNNKKTAKESFFSKGTRVIGRIISPTGITIAFLGPDGSGKSTIIDGLIKKHLPFRRDDYFHLKPILKNNQSNEVVVADPHAKKPYSPLKSYGKLGYFIYQYNIGWLKNILLLKRKSSLIIFDRYFDDLLVDSKRYRYGGNNSIANLMKYFIPRPSLYFVLTADGNIIHGRKQEVSKDELTRQLKGYSNLEDGKRYVGIDVSKSPNEIIDEIYEILMLKMNERY
ncbi:MAG: hypothetical protein ABJI22_08530 [Maribacter sp.]